MGTLNIIEVTRLDFIFIYFLFAYFGVNVEGLVGLGVIKAKREQAGEPNDLSYCLIKVGEFIKLSSCMGIWEISRTTFSSRRVTLTIPPSDYTTG